MFKKYLKLFFKLFENNFCISLTKILKIVIFQTFYRSIKKELSFIPLLMLFNQINEQIKC